MEGLFPGEVEKRKPLRGPHVPGGGQTTTWLTPPGLIGALGEFDLDPCAGPEPRPWGTAVEHWVMGDGSLDREWHGRVWLNPPFRGDLQERFMRRMVEHGRGTALQFARTETRVFFETVWRAASAVLFLEGRLHFHYADGRVARMNCGAPLVLVAYGSDDAWRLEGSGLGGKFLWV